MKEREGTGGWIEGGGGRRLACTLSVPSSLIMQTLLQSDATTETVGRKSLAKRAHGLEKLVNDLNSLAVSLAIVCRETEVRFAARTVIFCHFCLGYGKGTLSDINQIRLYTL